MLNFSNLNKILNEDIFGVRPIRGKIKQKNITALNNIINVDLLNDGDPEDTDEVSVNETLDKKFDLLRHYYKHVLRQSQIRNSKTRFKYDYMTPTDYYNYACQVRDSKPDYVIDTTIVSKGDVSDICDDFINNGQILKVDYNLQNKLNKKDMYVIFTRQSKYNSHIEVCIIEKDSNEPINIFPISTGRFFTYINEFTK